MISWLAENQTFISIITGISLFTLVASAIAVFWLMKLLPHDHFLTSKKSPEPDRTNHWVIVLMRNLSGAVLILLGLVMLLTPGQGIITIVAGVTVADFHGKRQLERKLMRKKNVQKSLNWMRKRVGARPFDFDID